MKKIEQREANAGSIVSLSLLFSFFSKKRNGGNGEFLKQTLYNKANIYNI
jgi:hypothetical protein